jgi:hypothetical protein
MIYLSTGEPSTLGTYRKIAVALTGEDSKAVKYFDKKIAESPHGADEEVIAAESQVIHLIFSINAQSEEENGQSIP